jgi:hypothetical protein
LLKKRKYLECSDETEENSFKRVERYISHPNVMDQQMK